jgi:hypothetical protein
MAKVTAHAGKIPVFLKFILFITRLLGYYWGHYKILAHFYWPNIREDVAENC